MAKKITLRGVGARYGKTVRAKYAKVDAKQRKKQECPFCSKVAKRVSRGIWECKNCKKRFASGTYYLKK